MLVRRKYSVVYEDGEHRIKEEWIDTTFLGIRIKREIVQTGVKAAEVPVAIRDVVYKMDDGECAYCGIKVKGTPRWAIDHIIPQVQYGTSYIFNLTVSCQKCNSSKNGRTPQEAGMSLLYGRFKRLESPPYYEPWLISDGCPIPEDEWYLCRNDLTTKGMVDMYPEQVANPNVFTWEKHVRSFGYGEPFTSEFIRLRGKTPFRPGVTLD